MLDPPAFLPNKMEFNPKWARYTPLKQEDDDSRANPPLERPGRSKRLVLLNLLIMLLTMGFASIAITTFSVSYRFWNGPSSDASTGLLYCKFLTYLSIHLMMLT
jgi:hypothetical protein